MFGEGSISILTDKKKFRKGIKISTQQNSDKAKALYAVELTLNLVSNAKEIIRNNLGSKLQ